MHLIRDIDIAVGVAKRWGMSKFPDMELNVCVYDTRVAGEEEDKPFHFRIANNLDDAIQILFDLSNQGYEIFQTCGNTGIVALLVQPSVDHSTNIDIDVMNSIVALFGEDDSLKTNAKAKSLSTLSQRSK